MNCKHCKAELVALVKACPSCGKNPAVTYNPLWSLLALIPVAVLLALMAHDCGH